MLPFKSFNVFKIAQNGFDLVAVGVSEDHLKIY